MSAATPEISMAAKNLPRKDPSDLTAIETFASINVLLAKAPSSSKAPQTVVAADA